MLLDEFELRFEEPDKDDEEDDEEEEVAEEKPDNTELEKVVVDND
ncbi:MAG: hypothetical protein R3B92_04495 [Patescibacteria group bacterium]